MAKYAHLGLNKTDTLAVQMASGATSGTLTTGNFGSPTGAQVLILDYDVPDKIEEVIVTIAGTALTSITRTRAVTHEIGAKVLFTIDNVSMWANLQAFSAGELDKVRVTPSAAQTLTTGVAAAIAFDQENFDLNSMHDNVTNNTRLTCKSAGKYLISGGIVFDNNATGLRQTTIKLNGSTNIAFNHALGLSNDDQALSVTTIYQLAVNDYVELIGFQDRGGNLDTVAAGTHFEMTLLA